MLRLVLISILFVSLQGNAKHRFLTLQSAMNEKLIQADAAALGGHQGFCITMSVRNLTKDSLVILLEAGRRLKSMNDNEQDILVVKEERIALKFGELKKVNIKGYCCQATKHSPAKGATYHVNVLGDSNLVKLARFLNKMTFDLGAEQEAVWAISDNHATSAISSSNDSLTAFLRTYVALLKSEKIPWYYVTSKQYVYSNGVIATVPLILKGKLKYSNDQENYATLFVTNEKGVLVCEVKSEWLQVVSNQYYTIELPVKGLPKGKYKVALATKEKELLREEFEI